MNLCENNRLAQNIKMEFPRIIECWNRTLAAIFFFRDFHLMWELSLFKLYIFLRDQFASSTDNFGSKLNSDIKPSRGAVLINRPTHIHTRTHTHTHSHEHKSHARTHSHTHTRAHLHTHTRARALTQKHTLTHAHTHTRAHSHTQIHTHSHTHTRTYTLSHTHTRTYTLSHTHTHTRAHTHTRTLTHIHQPVEICGEDTQLLKPAK
jgi:hypothetical protein